MSNQAMLIKLVIKSLNRNKAKLAAGFLALLLGSLLVSALLSVVLDIENSLGKELRGFGANYRLTADKELIKESELKKLNSKVFDDIVLSYAPLTTIKIKNGSKTFDLVGTDLKALKKLQPWLDIATTNIEGNQILVGEDLYKKLSLKKGGSFQFSSYVVSTRKGLQETKCMSCHKDISDSEHTGGVSASTKAQQCLECHDAHEKRERKNHTFTVAGSISSGGNEDNQFFTNGNTVFKMSPGRGYKEIAMSVLSAKISSKDFKNLIDKNFKGSKLTIIKRISQAEKDLLSKIKLLMILLTVVVLMTCGISVTSTLSGLILERRTEIGLMKAIGASHGNIFVLFATELAIMALVAGSLGYFAGLGLATILANVVFNAQVGASILIALLSILASFALVTIASLMPVRRALRIQPAITLRGE